MRALTFGLLVSLAFCGCGNGQGSGQSDIPPIPASHDPKGADLVQGAVIAATETSGGVRLNKVVYVDDLPAPLDYEFHMVAFSPKAASWEEAARLWKDKKVTVEIQHFMVRRMDFLTRDYRVLFHEKVTPEEKAAYEASKRTYGN